jgi:hypothetical protein
MFRRCNRWVKTLWQKVAYFVIYSRPVRDDMLAEKMVQKIIRVPLGTLYW